MLSAQIQFNKTMKSDEDVHVVSNYIVGIHNYLDRCVAPKAVTEKDK